MSWTGRKELSLDIVFIVWKNALVQILNDG